MSEKVTVSATEVQQIKASDLFIQALEKEGVNFILGVPGEENLDLLESIRESSIKLILVRHEQAAAFMAATYGRLTGHIGVCLSTLGPGATNLVTGAAYAKLGAMPMLMITGQKPVKKSKQGLFQIVDIVGMMTPLTKFTHQLINANNIPARIREAVRLAEEERPGPVHLELPEDIAKELPDRDVHIFERSFVRRPSASSASIEEAVRLIAASRHPLVLIGAGANRRRVSDALLSFIESSGLFFFDTQMGKGVVDERHERFLGTAALSTGDYVHCAIDYADLIINVGHDVVEKPPFFMEPGGRKVIHVNFSPADVHRVYFPQVEVVGDIANSLQEMERALAAARVNQSFNIQHDMKYFHKVKTEVERQIVERSDSEAFPVLPQRLVADVRKVMPDDGIIALDNGMYKIWFARNYKAHKTNTVLLDNALASMGAGLPSAMMAAYINPDTPVLAICGDGGFMMNSQEMETAVRLKLNLVVLIVNDSAYGMIKWKQSQEGFKEFGLGFGNPDFVKYAEAYGASGHRVEAAAEIVPVLKQCLNAGGVHIVDVPIDYSENTRVLTNELSDRICLLA